MTISMPKYIEKLIQRLIHITPERLIHKSYKPPPKTHGNALQKPAEEDTTKHLDEHGIQEIQQIVGAILYYSRAIYCTVGVVLSTIASKKIKVTNKTTQQARFLLDYLFTHPDAKMKFYASYMILNIHSDASYLSETRARSRVGGYYFLGYDPKDN